VTLSPLNRLAAPWSCNKCSRSVQQRHAALPTCLQYVFNEMIDEHKKFSRVRCLPAWLHASSWCLATRLPSLFPGKSDTASHWLCPFQYGNSRSGPLSCSSPVFLALQFMTPGVPVSPQMAKPTSSVKWAFSHMHRKKKVERAPGQGEKAAAVGGTGGGSGQQQWRRWGAKRAAPANGAEEEEEKVEMELRPFLVECKFDGAPNWEFGVLWRLPGCLPALLPAYVQSDPTPAHVPPPPLLRCLCRRAHAAASLRARPSERRGSVLLPPWH
jgi:hypothetical protein